MYRFRSNPPSRQIAPAPLLARTGVPAAPTASEPVGLHARIESYLTRTGMAARAFGTLAARDSRLVSDIRKGRQLGQQLEAKVEAFLAFAARAGGLGDA